MNAITWMPTYLRRRLEAAIRCGELDPKTATPAAVLSACGTLPHGMPEVLAWHLRHGYGY